MHLHERGHLNEFCWSVLRRPWRDMWMGCSVRWWSFRVATGLMCSPLVPAHPSRIPASDPPGNMQLSIRHPSWLMHDTQDSSRTHCIPEHTHTHTQDTIIAAGLMSDEGVLPTTTTVYDHCVHAGVINRANFTRE